MQREKVMTHIIRDLAQTCNSLGLCADDILKYNAQSFPQTSAPETTIETFLALRLVTFFSLENM